MSLRLTRRCFAAPFTSLPSLVKPKGAPATLPALPFDYTLAGGCPPVFSARQIELHYTKHHKAYVDKLNAILATNASYDGDTVESIARKTEALPEHKVLFNQAAQHFNHSFFWQCIAPHGGNKAAAENDLSPGSPLRAAIEAAFGSTGAFRKAFQDAAVGNFGSGWTWLVYDTSKSSVAIVNTGNAGTPVTTNTLRPLLTVDVWEHAYYKDFENRRADYVAEFWKIVNWQFVEAEFARVKKD